MSDDPFLILPNRLDLLIQRKGDTLLDVTLNQSIPILQILKPESFARIEDNVTLELTLCVYPNKERAQKQLADVVHTIERYRNLEHLLRLELAKET